jgi:hypothetical protein
VAYIELKYSEFVEEFKPLDVYFSDEKKALEFVGGDIQRIWTVRDAEGRYTCVTSGIGFVNRLEYIVTDVPWMDGDDIFVSHD